MERLAELAEYDQAISGLMDEDFLAAGFTPDEIASYRGAASQPLTTPRAYDPSENIDTRRPNRFGDVAAMYGNEEIQSGLDLAFDPSVSLYGSLPTSMQGGVMEPINREIMRVLDVPLGLLGAAWGIGQKGIALGAEAVAGGTESEKRLARDLIGATEIAGVGPEARMLAAISEAGGIGAAARTVAERANQPGPVPTMYSNPIGRPPVTFDDVERAMAEAPDTVPAQAKSPEPPQSSLIMPGDPRFNEPIDQTAVDAPRITPRDLEDARIIPTVADLTRAGGFYRGIDSSVVDVPEVMMGGPGFPLLPSSQENGLIWAVQGKGIGTKKAGKGADLIAVTAMNPTSHKSNISFINSLIKTTDAYVRDGRIGSNVVSALDDAIRQAGAGGDQALVGLAKFPGFNSPNAQEFINNASFQERSRIASVIGTKEMQEAGAPNVNRVLQETVDPKYAGANPRDTLLFIEPDFSLPPVDLAAEGLPIHPSYRYGIRGRVFGALDQNISTFEMFPDFWGEKNINAFGEGFNKGGRRAFDMSLPIQEVTGRQVEDLERIMTMEAAARTGMPAIDTRLLVNSLTDNWKPTTTSVKAGGASPQAFVDAINDNKYKPALTNYSPQEVKAGARSGDLVAYQLGDDDVFFALDAKPDYSWAGVDMQEGDKALVGVVSNAPGSKGTAAPSVIAKALDEGANILDAFAVPSDKFPDGFLPQYYGEFGFEEVGRVPFDKDMYVADHGELAYEDLLEAWRSDGWDESQGMPPVIVMRWSGSDADRRAAVAGIRGAGAPSHRAETKGIVATAEGSAGRVPDQTVQPQPTSVGRGDTGQAGTGDGLRLSSRAREGARGILGLTPEQLRNQGIPADQIEQIMAMRNIGQ